MKKGLFKKGFVLGIIFLFVVAVITPSTVGIEKEKTQNQIIESRSYIQKKNRAMTFFRAMKSSKLEN